MIIDFHTHIFPDKLAPRAVKQLEENTRKFGNNYDALTDGTKADLVAHMDAWGVDVSVVQPVVTKPSQIETTNRWAAGISDERIVAFGGIHPETDDYKRDIDLIVSLGLKGIKFHAEYQNFYPDEKRMLHIYDYAFSKGLIILHHGGYDPGMPPPFRTSPERFARAVDEMKGGTFVVAHLGGHAQWDDVEKYLVGKDVYLDTSMGQSFYPQEQFLRIVKNHGADRLLFGSDSPWSNAGEEIKAIESLPLKEEEKQKILGGNAEKILKL